MTAKSSRRVYATFGLLGVSLVATAAHAAGAGERCGRVGSWSATCNVGLACEAGWTFRRWSLGVCVAAVRRCGGDLPEQCTDQEYCKFEVEGACGFADEGGVCMPRPQACAEIFAPVCGCDGLTYGNACEANAAGISVRASGACKCSSDEDCPNGVCNVGTGVCEALGCEYDGATYEVGESFPAGDGCNTCACNPDGQVFCTLRFCAPP